MARPVGNNHGGITPLDVHRGADDPEHQVDLINAANEVPFLITASEMQNRKIKRRRKQNAPRP
jgi:hypothetical protein